MKVFFVIDETSFYHPEFLARFLRETKDEIVGAALVTKIPPKNDINRYLLRHWYCLKPAETATLAGRAFRAKVLDLFMPKTRDGRFYSVRSVLKCFGIDFIEVHYDLNKPEYLNYIKSKTPDVIVSSNSLYFGGEVLNIPKYGCINRHSALLPSYGGLWPVFQAYVHGESHVGASVHMMVAKIDAGKVLAQEEIPVEKGDTIADLYKKCFHCSSDVILRALEKIRNNDLSTVENGRERSYFSFPTDEAWKIFRKKGGRFV